ncbi:glycerate kinase [Azospira sp. APE16]|uniref:glycerate kinase type-2 family protein n=1 Tax=Azospira sp. APE16 TaxID=3394231 RepID=UPI003A4D6446
MSTASQKQLAPDALLHNLLQAALAAADPARLVPPHLPDPASLPEGGRLVVVGAGKAAGAMARAVEEHWPGPLSGLVVTRYGHGLPCRRIEVVEAAHPVPDAAGEAAAARILEQVRGLTEKDRVLALISGGGSALMAAPAPGVSLAQKRALTRALLLSGADIGEINCVRKHLSAVKGGRLAAAAWPAPVLTLAISDVAGDDPSVIASGPTVADPTTCADALAVLARHGIEVPPEVAALLQSGALETPKPGDPRLGRSDYRLIGRPQQSLLAAAEAARAAGITPLVLGDRVEGEAKEVAKVMAGLALACQDHGTPLAPPCVLLSGGETTVSVAPGAPLGRGGRNSEFLLALALALGGRPGIHALAADTDGIDGSEDNAGARIDPATLARAAAAGLDARAHLAGHDAYGFFAGLGDLLLTGPTRTNVNDFRAVLVLPAPRGG